MNRTGEQARGSPTYPCPNRFWPRVDLPKGKEERAGQEEQTEQDMYGSRTPVMLTIHILLYPRLTYPFQNRFWPRAVLAIGELTPARSTLGRSRRTFMYFDM